MKNEGVAKRKEGISQSLIHKRKLRQCFFSMKELCVTDFQFR